MESSDKVEDISNGADVGSLKSAMKSLRRVFFDVLYNGNYRCQSWSWTCIVCNRSLNSLCIIMSMNTTGHILYVYLMYVINNFFDLWLNYPSYVMRTGLNMSKTLGHHWFNTFFLIISCVSINQIFNEILVKLHFCVWKTYRSTCI